jgi:hypothetical protein
VIWWIVGSIVVLGLLVLVVAVSALTGHLRPLRRALRRLSWTQREAMGVLSRADALRERLEALQATGEQGEIPLSDPGRDAAYDGPVRPARVRRP